MQGTNTLTCSKTLANDSTQSVHKRQGLAKLSVCIPEQSKLGPEKISCKSMFVFMQRGPFHNQKPQSLISCTSSLICMPCLHTQILQPILFYWLERTTEAANCTILGTKTKGCSYSEFGNACKQKRQWHQTRSLIREGVLRVK